MSEEIKNIDTVTRVEGHAKISFVLDKKGDLKDAFFHVLEFKGFEKFIQGRMLFDAPRITTRVCGICPVSHHLASVKACEDLLGVEIPKTAKLLRELMHMGQYIHSHSLHFFFLAAPDFILGPDSKVQERNFIGLMKKDPDLVKNVLRIRKFGQDLIELIGGKAIHPVTAIPGGMSKAIKKLEQEKMLSELKELVPLYNNLLNICKANLSKHAEFIQNFAVINTNFVGLSNGGNFELYDGDLRIADKECKEIEDIKPDIYSQRIIEKVEPWTYLKFPFLKMEGWPEGIFRVGPLARLNICDKMGTPKAQTELMEFRNLYGRPANPTLVYHHARLIELLYAFERAQELLEDEELLGDNIRNKVVRTSGEGIGIIEAPRGTLIHHYKANSSGKLTDVNLIVATVHNNPAMNQSIKTASKNLIQGGYISEGGMSKIEMAIRAYDPCLTCAAHVIGKMPMVIEIMDRQGKLIKKFYRK